MRQVATKLNACALWLASGTPANAQYRVLQEFRSRTLVTACKWEKYWGGPEGVCAAAAPAQFLETCVWGADWWGHKHAREDECPEALTWVAQQLTSALSAA